MTFLPIVDRELRIASRKPVTYWSRLGAGILALLIAGCLIAIHELVPSGGRMDVGKILFNVLGWLTFGGCCLAGVFLTADCISEEKRDGTLGLLFLTDLRGYDVVLGKLLATSLQAFYGVLAVFPLLALPLLMGGVAGLQFTKAMLAIINGLVFSLTAGVIISTLQRDPQQSMKVALLVIAALLGVPLLLDAWAYSSGGKPFQPVFSLISPLWPFLQSTSVVGSHFWESLAISHSLAWIFFGLASWITPKVWHEKATPEKSSWSQRLKYGSTRYRARLRSKWIDQNPVSWVAMRERWQGILFKGTLGFMVALFVFLSWKFDAMLGFLAIPLGGFLHLLVHIWIATQASRFFVEARQTGALELLLSTPLEGGEIVRGQGKALVQMFLLPMVVVTLLQVSMAVYQTGNLAAAATVPAGNFALDHYMLIQVISNTIAFITGCIALGWFGMWAGLTSKKPSTATLKTYAFVQILPGIAISMATGLAYALIGFFGPSVAGLNSLMIYSPAFTTLLIVIKDIAFVYWSRRHLYSHLRTVAAGEIIRSSKRRATEAGPPVIR